MAVGGYGRGELAPYSDLDVVLVHEEGVDPGEVAAEVWYPLWDSGSRLDHSVRSLPEMLAAADGDLKVALGLLDVRHLAGDPNLTLRLRGDGADRLAPRRPRPAARPAATWSAPGTSCSGSWPTSRCPTSRRPRAGSATRRCSRRWSPPGWSTSRTPTWSGRRLALLDVRDVLHETAGRATDRVAPEAWADLATGLGLDGRAWRPRSTSASWAAGSPTSRG